MEKKSVTVVFKELKKYLYMPKSTVRLGLRAKGNQITAEYV
jgi:hypothetical protein